MDTRNLTERILGAAVVVVAGIAATSPSVADPTWEPWGLDGFSIADFQQSGDYLYAAAKSDGAWRRYLLHPDSTWVSLGLQDVDVTSIWANASGDTVYVADDYIVDQVTAFRKVDDGSWIPISSPAELPSGSGACAVEGNTASAAHVLLGGCHEGIIQSMDAGESWTCEDGCPPGTGAGRVTRIVRAPSNSVDVWAAAISGFFIGSLLRSTDSGDSWSQVYMSGWAVADVSVAMNGTVIATDGSAIIRQEAESSSWSYTPLAQGFLYSVEFGKWGSDIAVAGAFAEDSTWAWLSEDGGVSWSPFEEGLTDITWTGGNSPRVRALESDPWNPGVFFAGIDDNGVWRVQVDGVVSTSEPSTPVVSAPIRVLQNPARRVAHFEVSGVVESADVFDSGGRRIAELETIGSMLRWDGRLSGGAQASDGVYFLSVVRDGHRSTARFVWLR